jgi:Flp pilus assembly CpaE family ATPase
LPDFDIRLGITSFVLKLDSSHSIADALENAAHMDQSLWTQLVSARDNLDILGSAPSEFGGQVPLESFQSILNWARRQYAAIVVDLPGNMEDYEIATMRQAGTIFLVCGPDLVSLHTARQTIQRLHALNLLDRVSVLLNRMDKRSGLSMRDIEGILGVPILITIPTDERTIREAVREGTGIGPKTALGKQIEAIAWKMPGNVQNAARPGLRIDSSRFFPWKAKSWIIGGSSSYGVSKNENRKRKRPDGRAQWRCAKCHALHSGVP